MAIGQARMPLFDHIGELRRRLTMIIVTVLAASILLYFLAPSLILLLVQPVTDYLTQAGQPISNISELGTVLNTFNPLEGFTLKFKVALVFSLVVCCPIWIWQILGFFLPALKPNERKWVIPTFFTAVLLFIIGTLFCYFLILDAAFGWLLGQSEDFSTVIPSAKEFIDTILLFEIGFGIAFELPLVVFYLTVFNIVPYKKLRASWRVVYIVLMVVCAMVTPDANPVTMLLMFAAMAVLYEGSLFLSRIVLTRRLARQKREEAAEDGDADTDTDADGDKTADTDDDADADTDADADAADD
ncbi:MAG: twin-arginine translocase subunit TatC [Coriobacteriales bacterium]|jgi:sec-independent protein translocase protein TatC|nr:twin-arginine translocase subunit TatC [Coriobacteriales bacterium]